MGIALYFQNKNSFFHVVIVIWILVLISSCGSGEIENLAPKSVTSYSLGTWDPLAKAIRRKELIGTWTVFDIFNDSPYSRAVFSRVCKRVSKCVDDLLINRVSSAYNSSL